MNFFKSLIFSTIIIAFASSPIIAEVQTEIPNQWKSKKVAFLGDSITDKNHIGTTKNYWQYLEESLGLEAFVYGINGNTFADIIKQAQKLKSEMGDSVDAIIIFAGTNDYNSSLPLGEWYSYKDEETQVSGGKIETRKRRILENTPETFRGRINIALSYLKENFPDKQIILLTPIHRGYATFGKNNIQPDESFPNKIGLYIDSYVNAIKEAANVWAVAVIDTNSISGLYPNAKSNAKYFSNKDTDLLHPNARGHSRMAKALTYKLLAYPVDLK